MKMLVVSFVLINIANVFSAETTAYLTVQNQQPFAEYIATDIHLQKMAFDKKTLMASLRENSGFIAEIRNESSEVTREEMINHFEKENLDVFMDRIMTFLSGEWESNLLQESIADVNETPHCPKTPLTVFIAYLAKTSKQFRMQMTNMPLINFLISLVPELNEITVSQPDT